MQLQRKQQLTYNKGTLYLAIKATKAASRAFSVPKLTLRDYRARRRTQRNCKANLKKLQKTEKQAIVARILKLDK